LVPAVSVRQGDWKLIRRFEPHRNYPEVRELYNLKEDIGETKNLASVMPDRVKELDALIDQFVQDTGALYPQPNPAFNRDATTAPAVTPPTRGLPQASETKPAMKKTGKPALARTRESFFKARDRNDDGHVTLEEYIGKPEGRNVPVLTKRFTGMDADKDGKLTLEEMKAGS
jgi:hypothetical protein